MHWYVTVIGSYDEGWHKKHYPAPGPLADLPPDRPPTDKYDTFPDVLSASLSLPASGHGQAGGVGLRRENA